MKPKKGQKGTSVNRSKKGKREFKLQQASYRRGTEESVKSTKLHDGQRIEERERVMSGEGMTHSGGCQGRACKLPHLILLLVSSLISFFLPHLPSLEIGSIQIGSWPRQQLQLRLLRDTKNGFASVSSMHGLGPLSSSSSLPVW